MTNLTLSGWKRSVAAGVVETIPLQDFESAFLLAEDFLSTQGGWNPDDAGDPTGPGVPVSGITTEEAIILIFQQQTNRIYKVVINGTMEFSVILNENLSIGLSDNDVISSVTTVLEDFVEAQLENTNIELVSIPSFTGTVTSGPTTASERVSLQSSITGGGKLIDPKAIALVAARARFNLDNTHNVQYLYTESGKDIFVLVTKYLTTQYTTIDTSADSRYGIKLDADSFRVTTGVTLPNS